MARASSLLVRTNMTLAVSAIAIAITAILALNVFVIQPIAERSADDESALLVLSAQTWVELPPETRPYFELELAGSHDLIISSVVRPLPALTRDLPYLELLAEKLTQRLGNEIVLMEGDDLIWANVSMGGYEMQIGFSATRRAIQPLYVGIIIVVMGAAIVFATSLFIVQRITRPLVQTAERAESFRGGGGFVPLPEEGPTEIASLAKNFNTMAREISALLSNRTTLLAGISHDLRTPLARMRLVLELMPPDTDPGLLGRLERNLEAMDELIGDALRFARGAEEVAMEIDFKPYFEDVVASFDEKIPIAWQISEPLKTSLAVGAFRRVVHNLLSNGLQHGRSVSVRVKQRSKGLLNVCVIDKGPGIPKEYREKVFQPFFRLDQSRSTTTGGSGLGLAIVRQLCDSHGWQIVIEELDASGGTCVRLILGK